MDCVFPFQQQLKENEKGTKKNKNNGTRTACCRLMRRYFFFTQKSFVNSFTLAQSERVQQHPTGLSVNVVRVHESF